MGATKVAWLAVLALAMTPSGTMAAPLVLDCEITEGAKIPSVVIMVDEAEGIVMYGGTNPKIKMPDGAYVDFSMKITLKDEKVIVANNTRGVIVITKHDGKFVHSFVSEVLLPGGNYVAFGSTIWGKCVKSPFH